MGRMSGIEIGRWLLICVIMGFTSLNCLWCGFGLSGASTLISSFVWFIPIGCGIGDSGLSIYGSTGLYT